MTQPYYVLPLLIEQPTWGGDYIAESKHIQSPDVTKLKIGQAYELAQETLLVAEPAAELPYAVANASHIDQPTYYGETAQKVALADLIANDPQAILGSKVLTKYGQKMPLLIKFTQAQNNSYQLHVKTGQTLGAWQPKPESWFYFEKGLVTLGLKPGCDVAEYKRVCEKIHARAQDLSTQILAGTLEVAEAREQLAAFIATDHPRRFVNTVEIEKGSVIDLSGGGIHHSWELSPSLPKGNIVYEVQLDVKDDSATMRSFDQGSIKDSGEVRKLTIDDYFTAIDTNPEYNQPSTHYRSVTPRQEGTAQIAQLFANEFYHLEQITFTDHYQGPETTTNDEFHHLFVQEGNVTVVAQEQIFPLGAGWSLFVPAGVGEYQLRSQGTATVLKTTI